MSGRGVLVAGATGTQGGAVVEHLLAADESFDVAALTRDATTAEARKLAEAGATVVEGDFRKPATLTAAMQDVDAVFAVTDYWETGHDGEITQGRNIVDATREAGVDHVVYSSASGTGLAGRPPMLDSKARIEGYLREHVPRATILRPSYFVQNFELRREDITGGTLALPLAPGTRLPMTDATDVGRLVARIFETPGQYEGATLPVAGEERTLAEMASVFADRLDREIETVHVPIHAARARAGEDYATLFEWYNGPAPTGVAEHFDSRVEFSPTGLAGYLRRANWGRPELPGEWEAARAQ